VTVRVRIDPTLCRGHAICALFFAEGVELDRWGFGKVVDASPSGRRALRRARRAAAACPNGAVVVTERPDPVPVPVPVPEVASPTRVARRTAPPEAAGTPEAAPAAVGVPVAFTRTDGRVPARVPDGTDTTMDTLRW